MRRRGPRPVFRLPELETVGYRLCMTTPTEVRIAGVPWPTYKLVALLLGVVALVVVGAMSASAAAAVLTAAATTVTTWIVLGAVRH